MNVLRTSIKVPPLADVQLAAETPLLPELIIVSDCDESADD